MLAPTEAERHQASIAVLLDELDRVLVGKRAVLELVLTGLLADGHVLLEDVPGTGKTLMARSFAAALGAGFSRVQFTPDLLPADLTGSSFLDQRSGELVFRKGPVFTNVLLADEINRAPPKTQAALLEAMEERQVTAEGESRPLPQPFLVLATQNPVEFEGTYPLPEAQLDRFLLRVRIGAPEPEDELEVLHRHAARQKRPEARAVLGLDALAALQRAAADVHLDEDIGRYIVALVRATRSAAGVQLGASPRGGLALVALARAAALIRGRAYVEPDDVKVLAVPALAHRLVLRPELWVQEISGERIVRDCLAEVPVPPTTPTRP